MKRIARMEPMGGAASGTPEAGIAEWLHFADFDRAQALADGLLETGIRHLRIGISWADYHRPKGRAWFDWLLPMLAKRATLLPCVTYTPPSRAMANSCAAPPRNPQDYADFLEELCDLYGHLFSDIELWNEPNNLLDWDWRLDPGWSIFCDMASRGARAMHERGKRTVLAGMCPTDPNWLRIIAGQGLLDHIDVVGVHAFPGTWTTPIDDWEMELAPVREALAGLDWHGDIWITEAGYSTWRHDEGRQLAEFCRLLKARVNRVYWYSFHDLAPDRASQEGLHFDERHYHTGIATSGGRLKLAGRLLAHKVDGKLARVSGLIGHRTARRQKRPVVITGGCGFLGANLADRLAGEGRDVRLIDSLSRPGTEENLQWLMERHANRITMECADVRDAHALEPLLADASAVLHLAAQVAVTSSVESPKEDFSINAAGTLNVLEALRRLNPEAPLIFASTNKVYGDFLPPAALSRHGGRYQPLDLTLTRGIDETTPLDLHSPYGCSKGAAEQYVRDYARVFGLRTAVFRMSCIYGDRQFGTEDQGWVAHFLKRILAHEPVTIYGDGYQVRDILYVSDAVDAWLACLGQIDALKGGIFNLGGGPSNAVSLRDVLALAGRLTGVRARTQYGDWRPGDQRWYVSDTGRFAARTGWHAKTGPEEGIGQLMYWLQRSRRRKTIQSSMEALA